MGVRNAIVCRRDAEDGGSDICDCKVAQAPIKIKIPLIVSVPCTTWWVAATVGTMVSSPPEALVLLKWREMADRWRCSETQRPKERNGRWALNVGLSTQHGNDLARPGSWSIDPVDLNHTSIRSTGQGEGEGNGGSRRPQLCFSAKIWREFLYQHAISSKMVPGKTAKPIFRLDWFRRQSCSLQRWAYSTRIGLGRLIRQQLRTQTPEHEWVL